MSLPVGWVGGCVCASSTPRLLAHYDLMPNTDLRTNQSQTDTLHITFPTFCPTVHSHTATNSHTPLFLASCSMQAPAVRLLLDKGASCNVVDPMGVSPLFVCASAGCAPITEMLLLAKADPNVKIANGQVCKEGRAVRV